MGRIVQVQQTHLLIAFAVFLVIQVFGLIRGLKSRAPLVGYLVFSLLGSGIGYAVLVLLPQVI